MKKNTMEPKKKYSLFVSSTYEDLKAERQDIMSVALENDFIPKGMEQFHAAPASQWTVIKKTIDECDCFLLLVGNRYGSIDESEGISFTEKEYNYAKAKGIPVLVFMLKEKSNSRDEMDNNHETGENNEKLKRFRERLKNDGNTVCEIQNNSELKYRVSMSLKNTPEYMPEDAGLISYRYINEINSTTGNDYSVSSFIAPPKEEKSVIWTEAKVRSFTAEDINKMFWEGSKTKEQTTSSFNTKF